MIKREKEEEHSFFHFESIITGNSYLCHVIIELTIVMLNYCIYVHRQKANRLLLNM